MRRRAPSISSPGLAGTCQTARFYDLPNAAASGLTDAKIPDVQAGYEKGCQHTFIANAGGNLIYGAAGPLASITACSKAGLVIDNDIIGMALRTVSGITVDKDELALEVVKSVSLQGPGHYLGHPLTIERMKRDFFYPCVGNRQSAQEWIDAGSPSVIGRAEEIADEVLRTHYPRHIPDSVDARIRERLHILLPIEATHPLSSETG